jgi:hypothetical protein
MASNKLPASLDELITLGEDADDGARQLETTLGLKQNTEAAIRADVTDLASKKDACNTLDANRPTVITAQTVAGSNGRAFLTTARDTFKPVLGTHANPAWEAAGWTAKSIAIPSTSERVLPLLKSVELFLTKNPAHEVSTPKLTVTAARALALHDALFAARAAVNKHDRDSSDALTARDRAEEKLRVRLRGLIDELGQLLDPLDARWLAFGLKRPRRARIARRRDRHPRHALGRGQTACPMRPRPARRLLPNLDSNREHGRRLPPRRIPSRAGQNPGRAAHWGNGEREDAGGQRDWAGAIRGFGPSNTRMSSSLSVARCSSRRPPSRQRERAR